MILIKTLEVRPNVCDNLCGLIFFNKVQSRQNIENFRNEVLYIDLFLVHDKIFNHFFNRTFVGSLLLINEFVENVSQKLSTKELTLDWCVLSLDDKLFILDLCLGLLSTLVFKELPHHSPEANKDCMFLGNAHNEAKSLKKEDHFKSLFVLLKDPGWLMNEVSRVKDLFMMIIKEFDELFDKSADLLSGVNCVWLVHRMLISYLGCCFPLSKWI